jgi:hypothetical protein
MIWCHVDVARALLLVDKRLAAERRARQRVASIGRQPASRKPDTKPAEREDRHEK